MAKTYNAFLVFHDWKEAFEALDGENCKAILLAMFDYSVSGTPPPEFDDPAAKMASRFIFPAMERRARDAENGRKGGNKRVENAASKGNVEKSVESAVDNMAENGDFHPPSTPLEAPLNPPSTLNKTRQDKTKQNDIIQDEDEIKQSGCAADVSSVVAMAKSICKWLVIPAVVSEKTVREIVYSGLTDDEYRRLFYTANECDFLQGGGDRGWIATLDWLIEHRDDVIAGKYREWSKPGQSGGNDNSSFDTKEFFELALARSYRGVNTGENNDETT